MSFFGNSSNKSLEGSLRGGFGKPVPRSQREVYQGFRSRMDREYAKMSHKLSQHQDENILKFRDLGSKVRKEYLDVAGWNSYSEKMFLRSKHENAQDRKSRIIRPDNDPFIKGILFI